MKLLITNAIQDKQVLLLKYRDVKKAYTNRNIEPIYIHAIEEEGINKYILEAFCRLRQNRRHFRLDRVIEISETNNFFSSDYSPSSTEDIFAELSFQSNSYPRRNYQREKVKSGCLGVTFFLIIIPATLTLASLVHFIS